MKHATRLDGIEISLIRQISVLAREGSIDLGLGEPNYEPDEEFLRMATEVAAEGGWRYSPNAGFESLRCEIIDKSRPTFDPISEICVTAGTQEALFAVTQSFVDDEDEVLIPDPGFVAYPTLVRLAGGYPVTYPLRHDDWSIDVEAITELITDRTKMIIVNSPSNPTGGIATGEQLGRLAAIADEYVVLLVSDEVYREIYFDEKPMTLAGMTKRAIVLDGLSKSHGLTGLRIGWVLADATLIKPITVAHQYIATCASVYSQRLAERILKNESWNMAWLDRARAQFVRQRNAMAGALEDTLGVEPRLPKGSFYFFQNVGLTDSVGVARRLAADHGVLTVPGVAFGKGGQQHLRLSFAAPEETIREGIARVGMGLSV